MAPDLSCLHFDQGKSTKLQIRPRSPAIVDQLRGVPRDYLSVMLYDVLLFHEGRVDEGAEIAGGTSGAGVEQLVTHAGVVDVESVWFQKSPQYFLGCFASYDRIEKSSQN